MTSSLFIMTRRRKIGILLTAITVLFVMAALSSYYSDEPSGPRDSGEGEEVEQRAIRLKPRRKHTTHPRRADSRTHHHPQNSHPRGSKRQQHPAHKKSDTMHISPEGNRKRHNQDTSKSKSKSKSQSKSQRKHPSKQKKEKKIKKPGTTISVKMAANTDDKFDANRVLELFTSCRKTDDEILIDCYVDAYEELCKLFKAFGTVFGFVTSDVVEKIGILREYRKSPEAEHYLTTQSLLSYEVEKGITNNKKKASGSRTLLRLHRALEFIEELLVKIRDTETKEKFSSLASKAYDDTLAKHHPWLIKKAVHLAMYALPSRTDLLKKMQLEDTDEGMAALSKLIEELKIIYKITQDLYAKDSLLDLP